MCVAVPKYKLPNHSHLALHSIQSPLYLIQVQDTWCYIYNIDICWKFGIPGGSVGPGAYFAPTAREKVHFWSYPDWPLLQDTYKHYKCYITILQCRIWGRGTGGHRWKRLRICNSTLASGYSLVFALRVADKTSNIIKFKCGQSVAVRLVYYFAVLHARSFSWSFFGPVSHPHIYTRVYCQIASHLLGLSACFFCSNVKI
jgi:hypothetical protein